MEHQTQRDMYIKKSMFRIYEYHTFTPCLVLNRFQVVPCVGFYGANNRENEASTFFLRKF